MSYKAAVEMPARPGTSHLQAQLVKDLRVSSRMCLLVKFSTLSGFAPRASVPCHVSFSYMAACFLKASKGERVSL